MAPLFPAVLIGGPPHAGKSTLVYRLSQALRERGSAHYALRATPDGEGGWSYEAPPARAADLRRRAQGAWTPELARSLARDIAARHLPLLVDAGGMVSPETEAIAASCTHAVLLAPQPEALAPWRLLVERHGLVLLADLISSLAGVSTSINAGATLRGTIAGLATELSSDGPCFDALVERVAALFAYSPDELYRAHLALTEIDVVLHLERSIYPLQSRAGASWQPADLAPLLASLPTDEPLAAYGVGPAWVYAALAAFCAPRRFALFDVRHGWVSPPRLELTTDSASGLLRCAQRMDTGGVAQLAFSLPAGYLERAAAEGLAIPAPQPGMGVVLDGKLPNWLWAGLARAYRGAAWVGVYRPQAGDAVVVRTGEGGPPVGDLVSLNSP